MEKQSRIKVESKTINPFVTFLIISLISFIISFFVYISINGILIDEIIDQWSTIIDGWFSTESLFFLIFFGFVFIFGLLLHYYNIWIATLSKKNICASKGGKWDKKKKTCNV